MKKLKLNICVLLSLFSAVNAQTLQHIDDMDWDFGNVLQGNDPSPENCLLITWHKGSRNTLTEEIYFPANWLDFFPHRIFSANPGDTVYTIVTAHTKNLSVGSYSDTLYAYTTLNDRIIAMHYGIIKVNILPNSEAGINVSEIEMETKQQNAANSGFTITNNGTEKLYYEILFGALNSGAEKQMKSVIAVPKNSLEKQAIPMTVPEGSLLKDYRISVNPERISAFKKSLSTPCAATNELAGNDTLILDDGNNLPDAFLGWNNNQSFIWTNVFELDDYEFQLEKIQFYMKTEQASSNSIYVGVATGGSMLVEGTVSFGLSAGGAWFTINLNPIQFKPWEIFHISLANLSTNIGFPAGADKNAAVPGKSYFWNYGTNSLDSLSKVTGYKNGAFLIRAIGTKKYISEGKPVAVANVSPTEVTIGETVIFDASRSFDNNGQIVSYKWFLGDGFTSDKSIETHSFSTDSTYVYFLTVTDNEGNIGQSSGEIVVLPPPYSLKCSPQKGVVEVGGSQQVLVSFNPNNLEEGNYTGTLKIKTNGGNFEIPVNIIVDYSVAVQSANLVVHGEYALFQNYPNPFNKTTTIEYLIPREQIVSLKLFDFFGKEVAVLVDEKKPAGKHEVNFTTNNLSPGIYFYKFQAGTFSDIKKLLLKK